MRVLYNPRDRLDLTEFGIQIPINADTAARTMEVLLGSASSAHTPAWLQTTMPPALAREDLLRVHDEAYVERLLAAGAELEKEILRGFELVLLDGTLNRYAPELAKRPLSDLFEILLQRGSGTVWAGETALDLGCAHFLGGGFHHAMHDAPAGFCMFHDVLVAVRKLQAEGRIHSAWIIDVDAHKGDGTAALCLEDRSVACMSIHMARGWPLDISRAEAARRPDRSVSSFLPSTLDIPVEEDEAGVYVDLLRDGLERLWQARSRDGAEGSIVDAAGSVRAVPEPDIVYVLQGADPFEEDELPSTNLLKLTREQMNERDRLVHKFFVERGVPLAYVAAGSYGKSGWKIYSDFLGWALGY